MTEAEFDNLAKEYVDQVLNEAVGQLSGDHDDSSSSHKSDKLIIHGTSSDDDEEDEDEDDERIPKEQQMPRDSSSFGINDRYSADESSNTREQSADEDTSVHSSTTATPVKTLRRTQTDIDGLDLDQTPTGLAPPLIRRSSQSDTGTYFSAVSPVEWRFRRRFRAV